MPGPNRQNLLAAAKLLYDFHSGQIPVPADPHDLIVAANRLYNYECWRDINGKNIYDPAVSPQQQYHREMAQSHAEG